MNPGVSDPGATPYLPYASAGVWLLAAAVPPAVLAVLTKPPVPAIGWTIAGFAVLAALVAGALSISGRSFVRKLRKEAAIAWSYEETVWDTFVERHKNPSRRMLWAWGGGFSIGAAIAIFAGADTGESAINEAVGALLCGLAMTAILHVGIGSHRARLRRGPGACWIGEKGYFLTGEQAQWGGVAYMRADTAAGELRITFHTGAEGHVTDAVLPVPLGEERTAREFAARYPVKR